MKKEKVIKYVLLGISAVLVLAILVVIAINSNNRRIVKKEEAPNTTTNNNYLVHNSYEELDEIVNKLMIELNNEDESAYVLVIVTAKEDSDLNFNEYKKEVFKQREEFFDTKISRYKKVTIDGHEAEYAEIYYTNPSSINLYVRSYAIETDNYFGQMVLWTLASNEKSIQDEFDKIASSFIELNKKD